MEIAHIVTQTALKETAGMKFNMALAHLVGEKGMEEYTNHFIEVGKDPDKFILLDTGLIEGNARPLSEILEKAKLIGADEIIVPDVFQDKQGTLDSSRKALEALDELKGDHPRLMGVPQGTTLDEWLECAMEMILWGTFDTIGIPKVLSRISQHARVEVLRVLKDFLSQERADIVKVPEFHLLGCHSTPLELAIIEQLVFQGAVPTVRSCDTALAYVYAAHGLGIADGPRPEWVVDFEMELPEAHLKLLRRNMSLMNWEALEHGLRKPKGNVVNLF